MKIKKITTTITLFTCLAINAKDEISYTWAEINYEARKPGILLSAQAMTLDSSFAIFSNFYITADVSQSESTRYNLKEKTLGLSLGFHKSLSDTTDIYAELGYRRKNPDFIKAVNAAELVLGSRTILSTDFELITSISYKDYDSESLYHIFSHKTTEGGIGLGIEGLYKMTKTTHLHFGVKHEDSIVSPVIGFRWNW